MQLDLTLQMDNWLDGPDRNLGLALEAERLGYRTVWTEEAYGNDAVVPLTWIAARTTRIGIGSSVLQIPGRTPATAAMTAATLDLFSEGRLHLGLGVSGPQVVEGWHGAPFARPLQRTREYVTIIRKILARDVPVAFQGDLYSLPIEGGTGDGKPLRLILKPYRPSLPIYIGALGPKNVELTAEIADGWLPIFMAPEMLNQVFGEALDAGFRRAGGGKAIGHGFDVAPNVPVVLSTSAEEARDAVRPRIALYIGGMGSRKNNFSNQLISRLGFAASAARVQGLFLDGDRRGAIAAVPDELIDAVCLCGPPGRIADRLAAWMESSVTTMVVDTDDVNALRLIAETVLS